MSAARITVKLQSPTGQTLSIQLEPQCTIADLKQQISTHFQLNEGTFDMLWGYPLAVCSLDDDTELSGNIANNERVRIQLADKRGQQAQGKSPPTKAKSKRGATSSSSTPKASASRGVAFGARVMTLSGPATSSGNLQRKRPPAFSRGSSSSNSSSNKKKRRTSSGGQGASSGELRTEADAQGDICEALLSAVSGGSTGRDKALRSVFRKAVQYQYDSALSVARLAAAYSGQYTLTESESSRVLGSGLSTKMTASFPRAVGSRAIHSETVDIIGEELMRATLLAAFEDSAEGGAREILKPANLAKASPRIFWSLVKAFGSDIAHGLRQLFPEVNDWSWLSDRQKFLSEKAKMNLEQKKEAERVAAARRAAKGKKASSQGIESMSPASGASGAATAVAASVVADDDVVIITSPSAQTQRAISGDGTTASATTHPHPQPPRDALDDPTIADAVSADKLPLQSLVPEEWHTTAVKVLGADSALRLAILDFEDENILKKFESEMRLSSSSSSSPSSSSSGPNSLSLSLSPEALESWTASAQCIVATAIMKALCGGCRRLHEALKKAINGGDNTQKKKRLPTPADLRVWQRSPDALYREIIKQDSGLVNMILARLIRSDNSTVTAMNSSSSSSGNSSNSSSSSGNTSKDTHNTLIQYFSVEWVRWMTAVSEDLRASSSGTLLWIQSFAFGDDDEDEDEEDEEEEEGSDEAEVEGEGEQGWKTTQEDNEYIGRRVRCYALSEDFWDEGIVSGYLPPDEEEPMALWRVRSLLPKDNISVSVSEIQGQIQGQNNGDDNKVRKEKRWVQDLEEHELQQALALASIQDMEANKADFS